MCLTAVLLGCEPYRIEYHSRPRFYAEMSETDLPDRVVLDDGTIVVYNAAKDPGPSAGGTDQQFRIREEKPNGEIDLRAVLPQHVVANTLTCLQNQEYELLWDQMLSEQTKMAYEAQEQGVEEFAAFFRAHRNELAKTLNRMLRGLATHEVTVEDRGDGVLVCRFWPQIAQQFKFKQVLLVREGLGMKLLLIK
jgi:hypothetical protein